MRRGYRLVRNSKLEVFLRGRANDFSPLFDVEELDRDDWPVKLLASGVDAETARDLIAVNGGIEVVLE